MMMTQKVRHLLHLRKKKGDNNKPKALLLSFATKEK
jgi:hypothetical protein